MTTKQLDEKAWLENPFTWRNNRGACMTAHGGYITYGIPDPPKGRRETENDLKGGDRIGWTEVTITPEMVGKKVAVFTNIEIKGKGDRLKNGQIKWHNMVLKAGGISQIWKPKEVVRHELEESKKA